MRRKPNPQNNSGNYNNQARKPRFQGTGGDYRPQHHNNHNRPRKNYAAMREKYLAQARDALATGDRVLAENYFQHAEHCYRMMVEEGYYTRNHYQANSSQERPADTNDRQDTKPEGDEQAQDPATQLPAFLTANFDAQENSTPQDTAMAPHWEE